MSLLSFGQYIAVLREKQKLSRKELSVRIKVSSYTVPSWEKGISFPRPAALQKLAIALATTTEDLEQYLPTEHVSISVQKRHPIQKLSKEISKITSEIQFIMSGTSSFEKNIKAKALHVLENVQQLLESIAIVDEAFD